MQNTSSLHSTFLVALLAVSGCAGAQHSIDNQAVEHVVISANGAWMAAEVRTHEGDGSVRVWSTDRDVTFTIEHGQEPRISRDSRWASALQTPTLEESSTAKPANKRSGRTLVLLNLEDGSTRTFDSVLSYDLTYASTYLLYLQALETPDKIATKPTTNERTMGTLHQVPLNRARLVQIGHHQPDWTGSKENVTEFVTHPTSDHFAYVWHDEETGRDSLHICKWGIRAFYDGEKIESLCWALDPRDRGADTVPSDHITLGFLVSTETKGRDGKRRVNTALYTWRPAQSSKEEFTLVAAPS